MKLRLASFFLIMFSLTLLAVPARAQTDLYDNGPVNGQALGFTINFGQSVSDTFTLTANSSVNGMTFWAWMWPGTTIENVEIQFGSSAFGNDFFDQVVGVSPSSCFSNQYGFNVCEESASFNGVDLNAGTYWMTLSNAVTNNLDQAFWDVNSGEGCQGSGCPSQAAVSAARHRSVRVIHHPGQCRLDLHYRNHARAHKSAAAGIGSAGSGWCVAPKTFLNHLEEVCHETVSGFTFSHRTLSDIVGHPGYGPKRPV